jgi:hypothetical protein
VRAAPTVPPPPAITDRPVAIQEGPFMNTQFIPALFLQAISLSLLRHRLGHRWLRHPVPLIALASVVYQGLSPLLLTVPSIREGDIYRTGVQQVYADRATLIMSAGMLVFTIAYLLTRPERIVVAADEVSVQITVKALDWRWLGAALAPLAILTYEGRGYNSLLPTGGGAPLVTSLASSSFIVLVALTAFSLLLRYGIRWFLPVLGVQSLLLAAAGERTPVIIDAVALILLLAYSGRKPAVRQVLVALVLTILTIVAITGVRAQQGRVTNGNSGLGTRLAFLGSGLTGAGSSSGLVAQAAVRLDGVDFAAAIVQAESIGYPRLSAAYVPESLFLLVPSVAWPSKLNNDHLNPMVTELDDFGLQQVNFLPGFAGLYMGFLPPVWLAAFLGLVGIVGGIGERFLFRRCTPARFVMLAGAVTCALSYEEGLPGMLTALRAAAVVAAVVKLIEVVRVRRAHHGRTSTEVLGQPVSDASLN